MKAARIRAALLAGVLAALAVLAWAISQSAPGGRAVSAALFPRAIAPGLVAEGGMVQPGWARRLVITDLRIVRSKADTIAEVERISAQVHWSSLAAGRLQIDSLNVTGLVLRVNRSFAGRWSLGDRADPGQEDSPDADGSRRVFMAQRVRVEDSRIRLTQRLAADSVRAYDLSLDFASDLLVTGGASGVERGRLELRFHVESQMERAVEMSVDMDAAGRSVLVRALSLRSESTDARGSGRLDFLEAGGIRLDRLTIQGAPLALGDLAPFFPRFLGSGSISRVDVTVSGGLDDLRRAISPEGSH